MPGTNKKDQHRVEHGADRHPILIAFKLLNGAVEDNGDGIVHGAFAKNHCVEGDVNMQVVKDGQRCHWVSGRDEGAKEQRLNQRQPYIVDVGREEEDQAPSGKGRYGGAHKSDGQDGADVAEKMPLVQSIACMENNWWQKHKKEDLWVKPCLPSQKTEGEVTERKRE